MSSRAQFFNIAFFLSKNFFSSINCLTEYLSMIFALLTGKFIKYKFVYIEHRNTNEKNMSVEPKY